MKRIAMFATLALVMSACSTAYFPPDASVLAPACSVANPKPEDVAACMQYRTNVHVCGANLDAQGKAIVTVVGVGGTVLGHPEAGPVAGVTQTVAQPAIDAAQKQFCLDHGYLSDAAVPAK